MVLEGLDYSKSQTTISSFVIDNIPSKHHWRSIRHKETHRYWRNIGTWCVQTFCRINVWYQFLFHLRIHDSKFIGSWGCFGNRKHDRLEWQIAFQTRNATLLLINSLTGAKNTITKNQRIVFSFKGTIKFSIFCGKRFPVDIQNASSLSAPNFRNCSIYNYPRILVQSTTSLLPKAHQCENRRQEES
jgi:hypothetical protein